MPDNCLTEFIFELGEDIGSFKIRDFKIEDISDSGNTEDGGDGFIGAKLELSGQVYTRTDNWNNNPEYEGDLTLNDNKGGTATITGGKLSYTIETPDNLQTWDTVENYLFSGYNNVTVSDTNAKYFILDRFSKNDASASYYLNHINYTFNLGDTSGTITIEQVMYVYVDKDVTISGIGTTHIPEPPWTQTHVSNDFSLALKEGWNALYGKTVASYIYPDGDPSNETSSTTNTTISLNNPDLKWILEIRNN